MGYLLNPISFQAHAASPSGRPIGSIEVDGNLYARSIVPIDLHRPSLEADELFAFGLPARVGDALRLHVARVLVEVLAQNVRPHVAPDRRKEVGGGAAPRRSLPAVDERDDRMDDGGNSPRLQLLVAHLLHQLPAAVDEAHAELLVLHVAPRDVERRRAAAARLPAQHHGLIGAAHKAVRAADGVEHVAVAHLAGVVDRQKGDAPFVGERLERPHVLVVGGVDGLAARRAHGLERVDDDHLQVVVAVRELPELLHETVADALRLHHTAEVVVRLVAKMLEARLDAAERVLQAQVQHDPPLGGEAPEGLSEGHMERQVEPKPRLADLGIALLVALKLDVLRELLRDEVGHRHDPHGLRRLRGGDDVLPVDALVALGDLQKPLAEVEVLGHQRKRLALADSAPVQQLEDSERARLVHDLLREPQVLVLRPELHLLGLRAANLPGSLHGVGGKPVEAHCMVEHGGKDVVHGPEVRLLVRLARLRVGPGDEPRLPLQHVGGRYVAERLVTEVRQDLVSDDVLLRAPRVALQAREHVGPVHVAVVGELHGRRASGLHEEVALPSDGVRLPLEAPLSLLVALSCQLLAVPALDGVRPVLLLAHRHAICLPSRLGRAFRSTPSRSTLGSPCPGLSCIHSP